MDGCNQGEGLWAYLRIHLWFTRTTARGRSLRSAGIMNPPRCKHEHEIYAAIEKWEERYRTLQKDHRELELPDTGGKIEQLLGRVYSGSRAPHHVYGVMTLGGGPLQFHVSVAVATRLVCLSKNVVPPMVVHGRAGIN